MQVQVVVMSANMGCSHCRQRVTKVVTKMNGKDLIDVSPFSSKVYAKSLICGDRGAMVDCL
jgi:copper chaperone CopZ